MSRMQAEKMTAECTQKKDRHDAGIGRQGNAIGCCGLAVLLVLLWVGIIWLFLFLMEKLG